jgi:histidinol-phosphate aminotransferase
MQTYTPTSFDVQGLLRPDVAELEAYTPIQPFEVLSRRLGIPAAQLVKLDANENPYGPLPAVVEALADYGYYHIYPDPEQSELRGALSEFVGVGAAHILPTHGADEMLDLLCRLFLRPGDGVIDCPPTFGMYSFDAGLVGGEVRPAWRRADYMIDVEAIEQLVADDDGRKLKLLFLTSPNNPTGNWLDDAALLRLLALPLMVVLDEAYVEFADGASRAEWVTRFDNLVVLRTFSKAAGIAGLRLGYGICPLWLMAQLWKFKQPYNVNVAATVAGLASLRHVDQLLAVVQKIRQERARLADGLQSIPYLHPYPSQANFILCDVTGREGRALKAALEQQGILVRHYRKTRLENCIRISVGRPDQTERLLEALRGLA